MPYYKRIRELREDHDMTQNDVAEYLGMKQPQYFRYENGNRDVPTEVLIDQNAVVIELIVIAVHDNDRNRKIAELAEIGRSHFGCKKKNALTVHSAECIELAVNIHGLIKIGDMKRTALAGAFGGDSFGQLGEKRRVGSNLSVLLIIDQLNNAGGSAGGFIFFRRIAILGCSF